MKRMLSQGRIFGALLLALSIAPLALAAQQVGTIAGTVRATGNSGPLSDVAVFVQGTTRGAMTDAQGRFRILAVPAGDRVVMAQLIGRARGSQAVHVSADSTAEVDFSLAGSRR
jgi:iron complex outermembrane receptor protein